MATVRNMAELEKVLMEQCRKLCEFASDEVYKAVDKYIKQYYSEWTPSVYERTGAFLKSAFKTDVVKKGNGYEAVVYIDYESLNKYKDTTGFQVVTWANEMKHGGLDVGTDTRVWDDAMDETIHSGQLLNDCVDFLRKEGFKVVVW